MVKINLLTLIAKDRLNYFKLWLLIFLLSIASVLILYHLVLQRKTNTLTQEVILLQQELREITEKISGDKTQKKQKKIADNIEGLVRKRDRFIELLQGILRGVSQDLYLTQLLMQKTKIKIVGKSNSILGLTEFVKKLATIELGTISLPLPLIQKIDRKNDQYSFILLWSSGER